MRRSGSGFGYIGRLRELPTHQVLQGSRDNGSEIGNKTVAGDQRWGSLAAGHTHCYFSEIHQGRVLPGPGGVDLPCPPIIPAFFRTAESPEVLSCTPVAHQSERPRGFKTALRCMPLHGAKGVAFVFYMYSCAVGLPKPWKVLERWPIFISVSLCIYDRGHILPPCRPLVYAEDIVKNSLQPL